MAMIEIKCDPTIIMHYTGSIIGSLGDCENSTSQRIRYHKSKFPQVRIQLDLDLYYFSPEVNSNVSRMGNFTNGCHGN